MEDVVIVERNDFSQVIFHCSDECYNENQQLKCEFTLNELLKADSQDFIGIFKVGFTSCKEYYTQQPLNMDELKDGIHGKVVFNGEQLPKDDGEFYQFVYVSRNKHIRGASIPFQFKKSHATDFVCVEDDEQDGILIKSKESAFTETIADLKVKCENLSKSNETYERLVKDNESMINFLKNEIVSFKIRGVATNGDIEKLTHELKTRTNELNALNDENIILRKRYEEVSRENRNILEVVTRRVAQIDALKNDNMTLNKEKSEIEARLHETEEALAESKREKEELQKLSDELLLTNNKFISLEKSCRDKEALIAEQTQTIKCLLKERDTLNQDKELLNQELSMTRDKLNASEQCKEMLKTQLSISTHELEETNHAKLDLQNELDRVNEQLKILLDEKKQIENEQNSIKTEQDGAYFALQLANTHLEKRLNNYKLETNEQKIKFKELTEECNELKQRLRAGAEEYANLNRKYLRLKNIIHSSKIKKEIKREYTMDDLASQLSDSGVMRKELNETLSTNVTQYSPVTDKSTLNQYAMSSIYSTINIQQSHSTPNSSRQNEQAQKSQQQIQTPKTQERLTESAISRINSISNDNHLIDLYFDRQILAQPPGTDDDYDNLATLKSKQKIDEEIGRCEICSFEFPIDMTESIYEEHVATHFGPKCPICFFRFRKGYPQADFESHVNSHFNN